MTRERGRIKGPSSDPIEALRTQLREQDRKLDDLYRRIPVPPASSVAAAATGGEIEAFRARAIGVTDNRILASGFETLQFRWNQTGSKQYVTSGVTGLNSSTSTTVSFPSGLWRFQANLSIFALSTPTSGYVDIQFSLGNEYIRVPWRQVADSADDAHVELSWVHYFSSASTLSITAGNYLNATADFSGYFIGYQLGSPNAIDTNP